MLSYGYWQRRFGGDRAVIGRSIMVDSQTRQIVGVMPQGFRMVTTDFDFMMPLAFDRNALKLAGFGFEGIGRLKSGVPTPASQRRHCAHDSHLDGFLVQRAGHQSSHLREMENHSRLPLVEAASRSAV